MLGLFRTQQATTAGAAAGSRETAALQAVCAALILAIVAVMVRIATMA
jgi:hypothetical protein